MNILTINSNVTRKRCSGKIKQITALSKFNLKMNLSEVRSLCPKIVGIGYMV